MIKELKRLRKKDYTSYYDMALDIGVSHFVVHKVLHKQKISDTMKRKIEDFINAKRSSSQRQI